MVNLFPWGLYVTPKLGGQAWRKLLSLARYPQSFQESLIWTFKHQPRPVKARDCRNPHFLHELKDDAGTNPLLSKLQRTQSSEYCTCWTSSPLDLSQTREGGQQEMVILVISRQGRKRHSTPFLLTGQAQSRRKKCFFSSIPAFTRVFLFCF